MSIITFSYIFCICILFVNHINGFKPLSKTSRYFTAIFMSKFNIPKPPDTPKSRLMLQIQGATVNNALFRAELKKELTFFRGCNAVYSKLLLYLHMTTT